jgi:hypothetical protein
MTPATSALIHSRRTYTVLAIARRHPAAFARLLAHRSPKQ